MRHIDEIILHCSATRPSQDIGVEEIRRWHIEENGFFDIGYHFVIRRNGEIEHGRSIKKAGAHARGHNAESIGICLVGGLDEQGRSQDNFTLEQFNSLNTVIRDLLAEFDIKRITGHRAYANKDCPCFNVGEFLEKYRIEL